MEEKIWKEFFLKYEKRADEEGTDISTTRPPLVARRVVMLSVHAMAPKIVFFFQRKMTPSLGQINPSAQ
jgi:hypothetical protein